MRKRANIRLAHLRVQERRKHAVFRCRAMPRPEVVGIISVHAISNSSEAALQRQFIQYIEKFILAVVAAISCICAVRRIFHFVRFHKLVAHTSEGYKFLQLPAIICRVAW